MSTYCKEGKCGGEGSEKGVFEGSRLLVRIDKNGESVDDQSCRVGSIFQGYVEESVSVVYCKER